MQTHTNTHIEPPLPIWRSLASSSLWFVSGGHVRQCVLFVCGSDSCPGLPHSNSHTRTHVSQRHACMAQIHAHKIRHFTDDSSHVTFISSIVSTIFSVNLNLNFFLPWLAQLCSTSLFTQHILLLMNVHIAVNRGFFSGNWRISIALSRPVALSLLCSTAPWWPEGNLYELMAGNQ